MKIVQRTEQGLFILTSCSSDVLDGLEETASLCARDVLSYQGCALQGESGVFRHAPDPPFSVDPPTAASNTSQDSMSAWGSQPPEGGKLLPCCFALLAGCRRVTRKARSTPMPRHSYRKRDSAFG